MKTLFILFALLVVTACSASDPGDSNDSVVDDEPPFFVADRNAIGPLTLAELQINIPNEIDKTLSNRKRSCFLENVERRAVEAGDPADIDPDDFTYWGGNVDKSQWDQHSKYMQRILLGQAIVSWAMQDC